MLIFEIYSDILAEFHQPRSGIELLVDRMPFPNYGKTPAEDDLCSLANISARSLLNRIHHTIFFTDSLSIYIGQAPSSLFSEWPYPPNPDASLLRVCEELNSQLQTWYESIPDVIRPDLSGDVGGNGRISTLRLRYWSTKQNLYRPFVIYVTSQISEQEVDVPQSVLERCQLCLDACRMYLLTAKHTLKIRSPYIYNTSMW